MKKFNIYILSFSVLVVFLNACSSQEGISKGMYNGMQTMNEMTDPGLNPADYSSSERQTYQQYIEDRKKGISD
jgi:hypothetical protein